jgi:hypothetical protein
MARYYRSCYRRLLKKILAGPVLHVDETEVKLRTGKGYVLVLATAEEVVYLYRPTREGDFLTKLLKDFRGVLVSDFYAAYDALPCPVGLGFQRSTPMLSSLHCVRGYSTTTGH